MPLAQSFDTVGVLADEPERLQRAAEVLLGEPPASGTPPSRLLIAPPLLSAAEPEVTEAAGAAARDLAERLGAEVAETAILDDAPSPEDGMAAFNVLQGVQVWRNYGAGWSAPARRSARTSPPGWSGPPDSAQGRGEGGARRAGLAAAVAKLEQSEALVLLATGTPAPGREAEADERERARVSAGS